MARSDAYAGVVQSPVKKYLSWSSNEKCFTYWDKETKQDKKLELPIKFIHYDEMATVKGWHDASGSAIYANEVKSTKAEDLHVRAFKSKMPIAEGLYQDIKPAVNAAGGSFHLSLYAELNGEVVNFSFKGSGLGAWSEFAKDNRKSFLGNYINVTGAQEEKKGSVKYTIPVLVIGDAIEDSVKPSADKKYDELVAYFKARKANANQYDQVEEVHVDPAPSNIPTFGSAPDIPSFETDELPF
jgi:hypothetical protein